MPGIRKKINDLNSLFTETSGSEWEEWPAQ